MFSTLLSFLGGAGFRMVFGEVASYFQKKQDHQAEKELLQLQSEIDLAHHQQDLERLKTQAELGIKEIQVQGDIDIDKLDSQAFIESMKTASQPSGIRWIDGWNSLIRPLAASIAIGLWVFALAHNSFVMGAFDTELLSGILGWFFANRHMTKNGK